MYATMHSSARQTTPEQRIAGLLMAAGMVVGLFFLSSWGLATHPAWQRPVVVTVVGQPAVVCTTDACQENADVEIAGSDNTFTLWGLKDQYGSGDQIKAYGLIGNNYGTDGTSIIAVSQNPYPHEYSIWPRISGFVVACIIGLCFFIWGLYLVFRPTYRR
ncbi:MAG TPA: hypothetical protein VGH44_02770 [Candidatus Saccharimonadia bacterium]|jgi:hypothetical protein